MRISVRIILRISRRIAVRTVAAALLTAALADLAPRNHAFAQQLTVLYSFCALPNCTDGSRPAAGLTTDNHGALYGTTNVGGNSNNGTAFKLTPPPVAGGPWTESVLYSFCALPNCTDGSRPQGDLIMDHHGALYGTTQYGGSDGRSSTVFKLTPPAATGGLWAETVLYSFCSLSNCADGDGPRAGLLMDNHGALYGTTTSGGIREGGIVFNLIRPPITWGLWAETVLYGFCSVTNCTDGAYPQANLIMDSHGALYGTTGNGGSPGTVIGGSPGQGTAFKLTPPAVPGGVWTETVLHSFCSLPYCADGAIPVSGLIMDEHGALYGTTQSGGSDGRSGTVFKLTPPAATGGLWTETVFYSFCSLPNCADGFQPNADLIMDNHGALYGTTNSGGSNGGGTAFKLNILAHS